MSEKRRKKTKLFTNDVRSLLYAFGDVENPLPETVNALEDVLVNYMIDTCHDASNFARVTRRQKIKVEDFKFALKKDPVKHGRVYELLHLQKIITDAKKQFDNSEGKSLKNVAFDEDEDGNDEDGDHNADSMRNNGSSGSSRPQTSTNGGSSSNDKKKKKKDDPNRPKRKYTKSGKERKPYKKRAKKGEQIPPGSIIPAK